MFLHTLLVICFLWYVILITFPEIRKDAFEQNMQEDSGWSWSMLIMSVSKGLKHYIFFFSRYHSTERNSGRHFTPSPESGTSETSGEYITTYSPSLSVKNEFWGRRGGRRWTKWSVKLLRLTMYTPKPQNISLPICFIIRSL